MSDELQRAEDRCKELTEAKLRMERNLDEYDDDMNKERLEKETTLKSKAKLEADLNICKHVIQEKDGEVQSLLRTITMKQKEVASLTFKLEEEQLLVSKSQNKLKELSKRITEVEDENEIERRSRVKSEREKSTLETEIAELSDKLGEIGCNSLMQTEIQRKRETEMWKLKQEYEDALIAREGEISNMKRKLSTELMELSDKLEANMKSKARYASVLCISQIKIK